MTNNKEIKYLRMNYRFEKLCVFQVDPTYNLRGAWHTLYVMLMAYTVWHAPLELIISEMTHTSVTIETIELQTGMLSTLIKWHPEVVTLKSI